VLDRETLFEAHVVRERGREAIVPRGDGLDHRHTRGRAEDIATQRGGRAGEVAARTLVR
jgi:hypothetical protein